MNALELLTAVSAHLQAIADQSYTICAAQLTRAICDAAHAVGLCVCCGQYDAATDTRVLYLDTPTH